MTRRTMRWGLLGPILGVAAAAEAQQAQLPDHLVWQPGIAVTSRPDPGIFPGVSGEGRFETNSFGIRGPEWGKDRRAEYRVLFVGGSAVESYYLDQDEAWPALVGARLPRTADGRAVWVGNIGRSGHNSRDHVMEARFLLPRLPVDAVVVMMGVNDLGLRLAQDAAFNPDFLASEPNQAYQVRHAFNVRPDDPELPFYKEGMLGRLLRYGPDGQRIKEHQVVDNAGWAFRTWREYRQKGEMVPTLPPLGPALQEYARNAEEIARRVKQAGMRLVFVTQPAMWRAGLGALEQRTLWMGGIGDFQAGGGRYYTAAALAEGLAAYNRTLLDVCARTGVECLDLATRTRQDLTVFYDDCHFNEAGARAVAEAVAAYLGTRPPFTR